jgi:murein DD-endopeptidase MepM/ murein hydrolase activator NlpD
MAFKLAFAHLCADVPRLARIGGHLALLILVPAFALASQVRLPVFAPADDPRVGSEDALFDVGLGGPELSEDYLPRAANPITLIPKRERREIVKYVVQPNDTVSGIATRFEIKPETILWANAQLENDPDMLSLGEELAILPINGVYHTVVAGETVESIAKKYKVDADAILDYELNHLKPGEGLSLGRKLIVPGGRKPIARRAVSAYSGPIPDSAARGTGNLGWPVSGYITQKFWEGHLGIDIGAPTGTPVLASDSGFVVFAGWDTTGFGKLIVLDHGNGYATTYGHLDVFAVAAGDSVRKGQLIGRVGNTGRSTGPHLDFRIRQNSVWRNPFGFLK